MCVTIIVYFNDPPVFLTNNSCVWLKYRQKPSNLDQSPYKHNDMGENWIRQGNNISWLISIQVLNGGWGGGLLICLQWCGGGGQNLTKYAHVIIEQSLLLYFICLLLYYFPLIDVCCALILMEIEGEKLLETLLKSSSKKILNKMSLLKPDRWKFFSLAAVLVSILS